MIFCYVTVFFRAFERLEPDEVKVSSPVLRGGGGSNAASLPGGLGRIAQETSAGKEYFLPDGLGSVRQLAGAGVTLSQSFDPFGNLHSSSGPGSSPYGFAGEWTDASGLQHLRARYYWPQQGRFLTRDPFPGFTGLPQTQNPYAYALNSPAMFTDPSGEFVFPGLILAGMVTGFVAGGLVGAGAYAVYAAVMYARTDSFCWSLPDMLTVAGISALSGALMLSGIGPAILFGVGVGTAGIGYLFGIGIMGAQFQKMISCLLLLLEGEWLSYTLMLLPYQM